VPYVNCSALGEEYSYQGCVEMVETKFIIEILLLVITLAIVLYWVYVNYGNVLDAFFKWLSEMLSW
jgi:hypothetical protein